ncbi:MAG: MFS transporter [Rhizobiaceae bacterium]
MSVLMFLRANARWIAGGFLLTFFSAFGQTFYISLSAGFIREEFALTHGDFGALYMFATLASALTITWFGRIVDWYSTRKVILIIVPALALACVAMAVNQSVIILAMVIYALRLFGQGMMTQTAFTATARWFKGNRGRAISLVTLGHNVGEAILPTVFVFVTVLIGWRGSWLLAAACLLIVALPIAVSLIRSERQPQSGDPAEKGGDVPDWTRSEVLRDPLFYLILSGVMAPGFIGTTIFFHQVYLVDLRDWSLEVFATSFVAMAALTILFALLAGALIDKFSAIQLLPGFLLPLAVACLILSNVEAQWSAFAFMAFLGMSYGVSSTLFGALWPEVYGLKHLGSIRSIVVATMVFSTAMGPGVTGYLIDLGVSYPAQISAMGVYCLGAAVLMVIASRTAARRLLATKPAAG